MGQSEFSVSFLMLSSRAATSSQGLTKETSIRSAVVTLNTIIMGWAHATNSLALFKDAMDSSLVTSIECDVLMSNVVDSDDESIGRLSTVEPILSHPPHRISDLTVAMALSLVAPTDRQGILQKHLKIDFKEMHAVQPTFDLIHRASLANPLQKLLTLNADILPGPGRREENPSTVTPSRFLDKCVDFIERSQKVLFDVTKWSTRRIRTVQNKKKRACTQ